MRKGRIDAVLFLTTVIIGFSLALMAAISAWG